MLLKTSLVLILSTMVIQTSSMSALRPGTDVSTNDVDIVYNTGSLKYFIEFSVSFEYINSIYAFCFRERPVTFDSTNPTTCSLSNSGSSYECMEFDGSGTTDAYYYYTLSSDGSTISNIDTYTPNSVITGSGFGSYYISLDGTISTGSLNYLANSASIYELVSNEERVFLNPDDYKSNYVNTFPTHLNVPISSIIMPHNFQCVVYNSQIATLIFYGGFYRISTPVMIYSLVTYSFDQTTTFGAWQGISFSKSHAFRDMMAVILNTGELIDLYSLIASAPYDDTSTNINGVNDWVLIKSSGQIAKNNISWAYLSSFYRYYETSSSGD